MWIVHGTRWTKIVRCRVKTWASVGVIVVVVMVSSVIMVMVVAVVRSAVAVVITLSAVACS